MKRSINMKKKIAIVISMILVLALTFLGCAADTSKPAASTSETPAAGSETPAANTSGTPAAGKSYKIGVSAADLSNPYFVSLVDGIQARAKELGNVEIIVEDPKQEAAKQTSAVENFISHNVDGIIMIPFDLTVANESLKSVYADGKVKILSQSGKIDSANTNVAAKDYDMGYALGVATGKYIAEKLNGEAEIGMLNYPNLENILERERGIREGIAVNAPNAKVVATATGGTPEAGMSATETMLQANPNIKVIVSINDAGALGALSAVEAAGIKDNNSFIGGIDALDQALSEIKKGGFYKATVDTAPYSNGKYDLDLMIKMLEGEDVGIENSVDVKAVTADNIGEYNVK
jgi:ribose transport system substrate-binding protein